MEKNSELRLSFYKRGIAPIFLLVLLLFVSDAIISGCSFSDSIIRHGSADIHAKEYATGNMINPNQVLLFDLLKIPDGIYAYFRTNKGTFSVLLDFKAAPMTVANFIGLTEGTIINGTYSSGTPFYSGSIWHRVVKGHVIQGGEPYVIKDPATSEVNSTGYVIPNEISHLSHNKAGMIGMANAGPHTNTCEYYITLADRSYLDGNYTLFGEVADGMDVVNSIIQGDTTFSIDIVRVGPDAENFIVNNETFRNLVDEQWRKVNQESSARKEKDEKFIEENYPGLESLPDGIRYKILVKGKGDFAAPGSVLQVLYTGRLINGLIFAGSSDNGKPFSSSIPEIFLYTTGSGQLIPGLQESLMLMKQGEKRLIVIPPELAYGVNSVYYGKESGAGKRFVISPGEILILEVTLNKILTDGK